MRAAQRCREDPPHWPAISGGTGAAGGLLARPQEEHREGQEVRLTVLDYILALPLPYTRVVVRTYSYDAIPKALL